MIESAVEFVRKRLKEHLGTPSVEVFSGNVHEIEEGDNAEGVYLSLVNVEEEPILRNGERVRRRTDGLDRIEPPVHLNLYLLFAFHFDVYDTSLRRLSQTIELFQDQRWFSSTRGSLAAPFPEGIERLVFDFHNLDFESLNHLWGVLGGAYLPSVMYKVRLVTVQRKHFEPGPRIETIRVGTGPR